MQSGTKVAFYGVGDALSKAVEFFVANYIDNDNHTVAIVEGSTVLINGMYECDSFTINGKSISEYTITSCSAYVSKAEEFRDYIAEKTGYLIPLKKNPYLRHIKGIPNH